MPGEGTEQQGSKLTLRAAGSRVSGPEAPAPARDPPAPPPAHAGPTTVLVTGATGFVGAHVVQALSCRGLRVRCLVRATSSLDYLRGWEPELVRGSVTSFDQVGRAVQEVDAVVHCAGLTRAHRPEHLFEVNEGGVRSVCEACLARNPGVRRIVHISSLAALGPSAPDRPTDEDQERRPVSDYGRSKLAGHRLAESYMGRLPVTILIPPAVYGPMDRDFLVVFKLARYGLALAIGPEPRRLSLIHADDLARAVVACLESDRAAGRQYLVEDGAAHTWEELAGAMAAALRRELRTIRLPVWLAKAAAVLAEGHTARDLRPGVFNPDKLRELLQPAWVCTSARIRGELGFEPALPLARGVEETYRWYRENGWL